MLDSLPPSGYERLTISMEIETSLLEQMDDASLASLMTQDAQRQIKHMIQVRKNA